MVRDKMINRTKRKNRGLKRKELAEMIANLNTKRADAFAPALFVCLRYILFLYFLS